MLYEVITDAMSNGNAGTIYTDQHSRQSAQTQPGDFEVSLLILASIVIKAEGKSYNFV